MGAASLLKRQPWLIAFIAASLVHLWLFTQLELFSGIHAPAIIVYKELTVSLIPEQPNLEPEQQDPMQIDKNAIESIQKQKTPTPRADSKVDVTPTRITDDLIVAKASSQTTDKLQLSLNSKEFRRFLKSETERNSKQAQESIANFNQSFEAPPLQDYAEELSPYHADSIQKGGNNDFALAQDGKVTCGVRTLNMLDVTASPNYVFKDCTPDEKFDLKLNQPNNGWTNR